MREIKFRAWDKARNKMFDVTALNFPTELAWLPGDAEYPPIGWVNYKKNCIVMQSTGLLDKNGKMIFEGDLILCVTTQSPSVVNFKYGCFSVGDKECFYHASGDYLRTFHNEIEVIGNIYEHKHLLEANHGKD